MFNTEKQIKNIGELKKFIGDLSIKDNNQDLFVTVIDNKSKYTLSAKVKSQIIDTVIEVSYILFFSPQDEALWEQNTNSKLHDSFNTDIYDFIYTNDSKELTIVNKKNVKYILTNNVE